MDEPEAVPPDPADPARLAELLRLVDLLTPYAIRVAVTLGLPALLRDGTSDAGELAERTGTDPAALASLLHHLTDVGLLRAPAPGDHALTELGELLLHPDARAALDLAGAHAHMDLAWAGLLHTVRTGEPGYPAVHGRGFWDHLAADPALGASFDGYMRRVGDWTGTAAALPVWPARGTVVDVGGGIGTLLADVLHHRPGLAGVLVELPGTAARAAEHLAGRQLTDRVEIAVGSFFDPLPPGADAYVLAHILHDWPDPDATRILRRVAEAAAPHTRVLLIEQVRDPHAPTPVQTQSDLRMRVLFGSGERTAEQWRDLAATAGLRLTGARPCDERRDVIELVPWPRAAREPA